MSGTRSDTPQSCSYQSKPESVFAVIPSKRMTRDAWIIRSPPRDGWSRYMIGSRKVGEVHVHVVFGDGQFVAVEDDEVGHVAGAELFGSERHLGAGLFAHDSDNARAVLPGGFHGSAQFLDDLELFLRGHHGVDLGVGRGR